MVYLYPDLMTSLVGKFDPERYTLIRGKEASVIASLSRIQDDEYIMLLRLYDIQEKNDIIEKNVRPSDNFILSPKILAIVVQIKENIWYDDAASIVYDGPTSKCIR